MSHAETVSRDTHTLTDPPSAASSLIYRVDVVPKNPDQADTVDLPGVGPVPCYPVYWFSSPVPIDSILDTLARQALIDPVVQTYHLSQADTAQWLDLSTWPQPIDWIMEQQFLPGVTDNLATTVGKSLSLLFSDQALPAISVASGTVYLVPKTSFSPDALYQQAQYQLFNPLVQRLSVYPASQWQAHATSRFGFPHVMAPQVPPVDVIPLDVNDADLLALSQQRHLALTLDEMKVIQTYYQAPSTQQARKAKGLSLWPTDVELEIIAQTWSEHCKHKIFAAKITYTDASDPDYPRVTQIDSLFKTYIAGATKKLMPTRPDLLSVFKDNAGVVQWNDTTAVCFKVETHNSPSALEPYGGALTGIVGVNRDILGTGMGAKPLFNTDVFCFAHPEKPYVQRPKMLPPEAILKGVRKGVEDGGNKSGIPTVNGALVFDQRYRAKPLVFCGTGGLLPLKVPQGLGYEKYTQPGDTIVMAGGRVGKDGIHGATFSSEALHEGSPVSAVQIGDPLTQKRLSDFLMAARDQGLITGLTDNGAGGLSSSVGEMAQETNGALLNLEQIPLKYPGLAPYEMVISESQERMTLSTNRIDDLLKLAAQYDVELSAIGHFHDQGTFDIQYNGTLVGSLDLAFLHNGLPQMELEAVWEVQKLPTIYARAPRSATPVLLKMLSHPNVCSRESLIRQYDHEVQGRSVIKPLMGPLQTGPSDAAVIQPILGEAQGLVVSNGICPHFSDWDPYHMAANAVDEAIRNAVAVGADPASMVLLDNFCWPDPVASPRNYDGRLKLAQLVRANQALYETAVTYGAPFISGKDSMKNDFDDGTYRLSIVPTLLISAMGKLPDIEKAVSMDFKRPGDVILMAGQTNVHMGGSLYYLVKGWYSRYCPHVKPHLAKALYQATFECIQQGLIRSCHDLSDGGLGIALAESALASPYGADISLDPILNDSPELRWDEALFSESPSRFVMSVAPEHVDAVKAAFQDIPLMVLGTVTADGAFTIHQHQKTVVRTDVSTLRKAWQTAPATCYNTEEPA